MNMVNDTAVIVGSGGQDGQIMRHLLEVKGFQCIELNRGNCDIGDINSVMPHFTSGQPKYLFYFAAHHTSATEEQAVEHNRRYFDINTVGLMNCLDAIKQASPHTKTFFTSSSLIFQSHPTARLNEYAALALNDLYCISKYASMKLCDYYRNQLGISTTVGIMFNHESRYRKSKFVSKKIAEYVAAVTRGYTGKLSLGDLNAVVDWGSAEDYMEAAYLLLRGGCTGDYVISSGKGHSLRDFCDIAFSYADLDYTNHVLENHENMKRVNHTRIGDNSKLRKEIDWSPKTSFEKMIQNMVEFELKKKP